MTRRELIIISFMFGAALTAIPFMWAQEEKQMFKFSEKQQEQFCQKIVSK